MLQRLQTILLNNLLWFIASLVVAILVWFVATIEANPIDQRPFNRVEIQIEVDDGMIITSSSSQTARVIVRAQQSNLDLLQQDDITVRVDLLGRGAGSYTIPLDVEISRPASADTQPAQITVVIEQEVAQQIPVAIDIIPPSANYTYESPSYDVLQAEVKGAESDVRRVVQVSGEIDLSEQRSDALVEEAIQLVPIDENGNTVTDIAVTPRFINVSVNVRQREDAREVVVRPDIQFDTLPANFEFRNVNSQPGSVIISGPPEILAELGDTVRTEPISLEGRTNDFTVEVPLVLPENAGLLVLSGTGTISVEISINEQTTTLPLENISVTLIGLSDGFTNRVTPEVISLFLNGPVSLLSDVVAADVQAVIDVNGLTVGTYDLVPQIVLRNGQVVLNNDDITLLPSKVSVVIAAPQPEATAEATVETGE
jgi:hypothetical protein